MYAVLAIVMAACRYWSAVPAIVFTAVVAIFSLSSLGILPSFDGEKYWIIFSTMFIAGSCIAAIQITKGLSAAIGPVLVVGITLSLLGLKFFGFQIILVACVITLGNIRPIPLLKPPLDLSYGIYIYAFPVQQVVAQYCTNFWVAFVTSASVTFALATLSALLIEVPARTSDERDRPAHARSSPGRPQ